MHQFQGIFEHVFFGSKTLPVSGVIVLLLLPYSLFYIPEPAYIWVYGNARP